MLPLLGRLSRHTCLVQIFDIHLSNSLCLWYEEAYQFRVATDVLQCLLRGAITASCLHCLATERVRRVQPVRESWSPSHIAHILFIQSWDDIILWRVSMAKLYLEVVLVQYAYSILRLEAIGRSKIAYSSPRKRGPPLFLIREHSYSAAFWENILTHDNSLLYIRYASTHFFPSLLFIIHISIIANCTLFILTLCLLTSALINNKSFVIFFKMSYSTFPFKSGTYMQPQVS